MFRVMLVNVPFANCDRPSLGLSLLKAALTREGIHCDVAYLNLSYARAAADDTSPESRQLLADLPVMRSRATAFLDACLSERDWRSYDLVGFTSTFSRTYPPSGWRSG